MHTSTIILLFLSTLLPHANCIRHCCQGENVLINGTCRNGLNMTEIPCKTKIQPISSKENSHYYIETYGTLIVTDEFNMGYVKINPDKYCLTQESEHDSILISACIEPNQPTHPTIKAIILITVKAILAFVTVLFLLPVIIIYLFIPTLHDLEGKCILHFTLGLFIAHLTIIFLPIIRYVEPHVCNTTAFIYYTSMVCCYNWLTVLSFHLWRITMDPTFTIRIQWCSLYLCYGYGIPLILVATSLVQYNTIKSTRLESQELCWVDGSILVWMYFYGATMVTLVISILLQFWAIKVVWKGIVKSEALKKKSYMYTHLLLVMCQARILDIITYVYFQKQNNYLNYIWEFFDCRNLLIGGPIFFIFVILRSKVLKALGEEDHFCVKFPEKWKKLIDKESVELEKF